MSVVFSFRLNKNNIREEKALQVLHVWFAKGYSLRQILTEALLKLDVPSSNFSNEDSIRDLLAKLSLISQQLDQWGESSDFQKEVMKKEPETDTLSDSFISSIRKTAKTGINLNNSNADKK